MKKKEEGLLIFSNQKAHLKMLESYRKYKNQRFDFIAMNLFLIINIILFLLMILFIIIIIKERSSIRGLTGLPNVTEGLDFRSSLGEFKTTASRIVLPNTNDKMIKCDR